MKTVRRMRVAGALWAGVLSGTGLFAGCDKPAGHSADAIVQAEKHDERLARATAEARRRWPEFVAEFGRRRADAACLVKAPFTGTRGEVEHMWVKPATLDASTLTGELLSDPFAEFDIKAGDTVVVPVGDVEDWAVQYSDGTTLGSFHAPVLEQIEKEGGGG